MESTMPRLSRHLQPDEKVLWSGRPVLMPFLLSGLVVVPVMAVVWMIFTVLFIMFVLSSGDMLFPLLFFSSFFLIGLF